jgi:glucose-1-phosphate cytidylyltransferase
VQVAEGKNRRCGKLFASDGVDTDRGLLLKVVILAGGLGTRLAEETQLRPKPMVEIGTRPMIWHIMKIYSAHGLNDFIICCGYKGYVIKEYFSNYFLHNANVTFDLAAGQFEIHESDVEPWRVTLIDTGESTQTGGRVARIAPYLDDDDFALTYGDAVANIDISSLMKFHETEGRLATITAVRPPARFGALEIADNAVTHFREKPVGSEAWINGGFFMVKHAALDYITGDDTLWEQEPLEQLARDGNLSAYHHDGFWQAMDTLRDRTTLEELWRSGAAPWKIW